MGFGLGFGLSPSGSSNLWTPKKLPSLDFLFQTPLITADPESTGLSLSGTKINSLSDFNGGSIILTKFNDARRLDYDDTQALNGYGAIVADPTVSPRMESATGGIIGNAAHTLITVLVPTAAPSGFAAGISYGPSAEVGGNLSTVGGMATPGWWGGGSGKAGPNTETLFSIDEPHLLCKVFNGTTVTIYVDGEIVATLNDTYNISSAGLGFISWSGTNSQLAALYYAGAWMSAAITDDDRLSFERWAKRKYIDLAKNGQIIFDGDSLTAGTGSTGGQTYPVQIASLIEEVFDSTNLGVPSQTIVDMQSDEITQIEWKYSSLRAFNVIVAWGGTNDIFFFATGAGEGVNGITTAANYATYCLAARNAGFTVIACTIIPRTAGMTAPQLATYESERTIFNNTVRANWTNYASALADLADDVRLQDPTSLVYFSGDNVHLNNAGYGVVALLISAIINGII